MFTKSKEADTAVVQQAPSKRTNRANAPSIISADLTVVGTLISSGDLQVDGRIEGDIRASALVIGDEALIQGDVYAEDATIRGRVQGGIRAKKVQLCATSHVEGDILHEALAMEAGAFFEGNCRHSDDPLSEAPKVRGPEQATQRATATPDARAENSAGAANGSAPGRAEDAHAKATPAQAAASFTPIDR